MRIAIFSDIHANIPALDAVLEDIGSRKPDAVYCLGDLVGYSPFPNEVVERIRREGIPTIMGNYDDGVGFDRDDCGCAYREAEETFSTLVTVIKQSPSEDNNALAEDAMYYLALSAYGQDKYDDAANDLNDLLSKNRKLETHFQFVLKNKTRAVEAVLAGLTRGSAMVLAKGDAAVVATSMVVVLTYWLSYEYVRNPREALEPAHAQGALLRGAHHTLHLLAPYLATEQRRHLLTLSGAYSEEDQTATV